MEYHRQRMAYRAMFRLLQQWATAVSLLVVLITGVSCKREFLRGESTDVNFSMAWAKKWQDTHYDGAVGSAYGYGIAVDDRGFLYISGATRLHRQV